MKIKRLCKLISYGLSFVLCCQLYSSVAFAQTTQQEIQLAAYPNSTVLGVNRFSQEKDKWCWAACIQMIASYEGINISQSSICQRTFGNTNNQGATTPQISSTLDGIVGGPASYRYSYLSFDEVRSRLSVTRNPFIASVAWVSGGRHAIVCYGYSDMAIHFHDPWDSTPTSYTVTYSSAISNANFGTTGNGTWNESVVYG